MNQVKSLKYKVKSGGNLLRKFLIGKRDAFTVAELLVAVGLFVTIIAIATGSYVRMIQQQRLMTGLMAANDNVSLALEQIMREIRTGRDFSDPGEGLTEISFINDEGCDVSYAYSAEDKSIIRSQDEGVEICVFKEGAITSEDVIVDSLTFDVIPGGGVGVLGGTDFELIKIVIEVSNKEAAGIEKKNRIETKVSARKYFGG